MNAGRNARLAEKRTSLLWQFPRVTGGPAGESIDCAHAREDVPMEAKTPRPLHLVIVDSLNPILLQREVAAGRLPALAFLLQEGRMYRECVSVFPTVTPTALASLATGRGPEAHGVGGVMWYSREEDRYVHYWPSHQSLFQGTVGRILRDVIVHLNGSHLKIDAPTLFQQLEEAGICCGSINFPLSRGSFLHRFRPPRILRWLSSLPRQVAMRGPRHFWYGDGLRPPGIRPAGIFRKYGLTDVWAGNAAAQMISDCHPDFQLTYFNENDLHSHQHGPLAVAFSLHTVDAQLAKMLSAYGSWKEAVRRARWIVVGDHSQSDIGGVAGYDLNVYHAFDGLRVAPLAKGGLYRDGWDLACAPNDRSLLIYVRDRALLPRIVELLARWPHVDQICWQEEGENQAFKPAIGARFAWRSGGPVADERGDRWTVSGDLRVFELRSSGSTLLEGDYPDALHRVDAALRSGPDLVVNANLGYEFTTGFTMGRGNHGSLHRLDSMVPLVALGVEDLPVQPRITDLLGVILAAFGMVPGTMGACSSVSSGPGWPRPWRSS